MTCNYMYLPALFSQRSPRPWMDLRKIEKLFHFLRKAHGLNPKFCENEREGATRPSYIQVRCACLQHGYSCTWLGHVLVGFLQSAAASTCEAG